MGWLHDRTMECVRYGFTDVLRREGYETKRERRWYYAGDDFVRNVSILGRSNTWSFQIALSISFPALDQVMHDVMDMPHVYPSLAQGIGFTPLPTQARLGNLASSDQSGFWEITPNTDLRALCDRIIDAWDRYGGPWMERLSNLREVHRALKEHHDFGVSTYGERYPDHFLLQMFAVSVALHDNNAARTEIDEYLSKDRPAAVIERLQRLRTKLAS